MKSAHALAVIIVTILLASCKIRVVVPEGGSVVNTAGGFSCAPGGTCDVDVVDFFFDQTAVAKPEAGYRFKAWRQGERRFCGGDTKPCRIFTVGLNSDEALATLMTEFFESDEVFYLQPIFEKIAEDVETPCGQYPNPSTSPYVLPFRVGESYRLHQGNCTFLSHVQQSGQGFAYDFLMPIGSDIVAMRSGVVVWLRETFSDNSNVGDSNAILIKHDDNSETYYVHLTKNGALVSVGEYVEQGQLIGLSGHSGSWPHVPPHLHVGLRDPKDRKNDRPVTFNNISPPGTAWLLKGQIYKALSY
jgi:hypothetical protein